MVREDVHRPPSNFPPRFLRLSGGETLVGAILLPPLARQPRILPTRPRHRGPAGRQQDDQANRGPLLPPLLRPLHQTTVRPAEEEVPHHPADREDRAHEVGRGRQDWGRGQRRDVRQQLVAPAQVEH